MGEAGTTVSGLDLTRPITEGTKREDGHWVDPQGTTLPVSASDRVKALKMVVFPTKGKPTIPTFIFIFSYVLN